MTEEVTNDSGLPLKPVYSVEDRRAEEALPGLADKAIQDGCHRLNPRPCTREDLLRLYRAAW